MNCDRCGKEIPFRKPIHTCNVINSADYTWNTYVLCGKCDKELREFLGGEEHK